MRVFQFIYKCQHSNISLNDLLYLITRQRYISKEQKALKWKVEVESMGHFRSFQGNFLPLSAHPIC